MRFGIIGNGSWGTALAKILTDNGHTIHWWNRSELAISQFIKRCHNPHYLQAARFDMKQVSLTTNLAEVIEKSDVIVLAVPSAFVSETLSVLDRHALKDKKILSAVKGILPDHNKLVNDFLLEKFEVPLSNYFAVMGPCHAEEVAAEKLSYLTFSGINKADTAVIASNFNTAYIKTIVNKDIYGVQYAAILKNIYALGAGIAHGMDYGDNFLSVLIANSADEMAGFLRKAGIINAEVGYIEHNKSDNPEPHNNYAASVYMGDLLVTCYSLYSRNRTFGAMIGKGYSVKSAQLEMNMVAEGYNASRCMYLINQTIGADMPIAKAVYNILWENTPCEEAFSSIEEILI